MLNLQEKMAALMWKTQLVDAGVSQQSVDGRTPEAFQMEGEQTRKPWLKQAQAIINALPSMVPDLVWGDGMKPLLSALGPAPFVEPARAQTMLRDIDRLRDAIRNHDPAAADSALDKCERWFDQLRPNGTAISHSQDHTLKET